MPTKPIELSSLTPAQRHVLWVNATKRSPTDEDARALVVKIETSGLDYQEHKRLSISIYGPLGRKMRKVVFSTEGTEAALSAQKAGQPPLAGIDPLLQASLGPAYGKDDESTSQAGYLVADLMRQNGFELTGKTATLPANCVAKTAKLFVRK